MNMILDQPEKPYAAGWFDTSACIYTIRVNLEKGN